MGRPHSAVTVDSPPQNPVSDEGSDSDEDWTAGRYIPDVPSGEESWSILSEAPTLDALDLAIAMRGSDETTLKFPTFDSKWSSRQNCHTGHEQSASTSTSNSALHSAKSSISSNNGLGRPLDNEGPPPPGGNDKHPERQGPNAYNPRALDGKLNLACLFRKHEPGKYSLRENKYRTCVTTPYPSMKRLK